MLTRQAALMIALPAPLELIERLTELQRQYCAKADAQDLRGIHEPTTRFTSRCSPPAAIDLRVPMRAKSLTRRLAVSAPAQHEIMIELLRGRDNWALAQLCVEHMQYSKSDYLTRIAAEKTPN